MRFRVPQFLDIEDKLFGPLTFFQFAYLIGGGGFVFVIYKLLPIWIGIFLIIPIVLLSLALAFYKINNKPFIYYVQAGINYYTNNKLYVWKQRLVKTSIKKEEEAPQRVSVVPKVPEHSTLKDLAWSLDIQDKEKEI